MVLNNSSILHFDMKIWNINLNPSHSLNDGDLNWESYREGPESNDSLSTEPFTSIVVLFTLKINVNCSWDRNFGWFKKNQLKMNK